MKRGLAAAAVLAMAALATTACDDADHGFVPPSSGHSSGQGGASHRPKPTPGQQDALESAKLYLGMGSGFSRAGLIEQLHSQDGEGYPLADAVWAVDHSHADWNAQAVMAAKTYQKIGGFSRAELLAQLRSKDGEGFTPAQAAYAVHTVLGT